MHRQDIAFRPVKICWQSIAALWLYYCRNHFACHALAAVSELLTCRIKIAGCNCSEGAPPPPGMPCTARMNSPAKMTTVVVPSPYLCMMDLSDN